MGNVLCKICRRTENDSTNPEPLIEKYQDSDSDNSDCDDIDSCNSDVITQSSSEDSKSDWRCCFRFIVLLFFNPASAQESGLDGEARTPDSLASRDTKPKTYQFTCYDELDPTWLRAVGRQDYRIYVHGEILEWIVPKINKILNENLRATVEEVHHHNLDGPVYLITFYGDIIHARYSLKEIKDELKYKMPWKTNPTFFVPWDPDFPFRKKEILNKLRDLNLLDGCSRTLLSVNWWRMREIEIFEFSNDLSLETNMQVETIFRIEFWEDHSLYVCDQFEWHRICKNYIEVDKVAMDVCIEEWNRHDLLKDFSIEDIVHLDLANKDYRDPYYNEYLDRYIEKLLQKALLQLYLDDEGTPIFLVKEYEWYISDYFASRVDDKINFTIVDNMWPYAKYRKEVNLIDNEPSPDTLNHRHYTIEYNISNYKHFSDPLFRRLLNNSNKEQTYKIRFDREFNFTYPTNDKEMVQHLTNDQRNKSSIQKYVLIEFLDCIETNAQKLVDFVTYLFKLFREAEKINVEVKMYFTNCMLDDYSFFEHFKNNFEGLEFTSMKISTRQMKILSSALTQQRQVIFKDCEHLTDNDLMILLENIALRNLRIYGSNSCTPAIYYLVAEYLMNKEGVDTIIALRVKEILYNWPYNLDEFELFNNGDQIVLRNRRTKELVDLYCLLNDIEEDLDPSNRMYME